jgi:ubiquinone/menaquinone biosynthesis C-methylase UbiE
MLKRTPELELMNDFEQARAYALADFEEPHNHFIELFGQRFPRVKTDGTVLDLGCGPGDITMRFANAYPDCRIHAIDGAENMLFFARQNIDAVRLHNQIRLIHGTLPDITLPMEKYDVIISNSLLHHLADPQVLWECVKNHARPGSALFIMDLMRPASREQANQLVDDYAASEPTVLREDFFNSLLAAYRPDEIQEQLQQAGLEKLAVEVVSDRHLIVFGQLS